MVIYHINKLISFLICNYHKNTICLKKEAWCLHAKKSNVILVTHNMVVLHLVTIRYVKKGVRGNVVLGHFNLKPLKQAKHKNSNKLKEFQFYSTIVQK